MVLKSLNDPQVTKVLKTIAREHQLVILDLGPAPGRETRMFEDGEHCPIDAVILVALMCAGLRPSRSPAWRGS